MAISSGQVTVTTERISVISDDRDGCEAVIYNNSNSRSVYLGNSQVTYSNGLELPKGEAIKINLGPVEEIYGVTASDTALVTYLLTKNQ